MTRKKRNKSAELTSYGAVHFQQATPVASSYWGLLPIALDGTNYDIEAVLNAISTFGDTVKLQKVEIDLQCFQTKTRGAFRIWPVLFAAHTGVNVIVPVWTASNLMKHDIVVDGCIGNYNVHSIGTSKLYSPWVYNYDITPAYASCQMVQKFAHFSVNIPGKKDTIFTDTQGTPDEGMKSQIGFLIQSDTPLSNDNNSFVYRALIKSVVKVYPTGHTSLAEVS